MPDDGKRLNRHGFATRVIHAGQSPDPTTGAIIPPIYATSTYIQESPGVHKGYEYSRTGNPTRTALEECVAALEGAEYGLAFASGLAATTAMMSLFSPGDHIVAGDDLYGGTYRLFDKVLPRTGGLDFTYADTTDAASVEEALRPETRLLWVETPTNPLLKLVDLHAVAEIGRKRGVLTACDNTFATPWSQRPLEFGFDLVMHSATKYLNGHSDVVAGALVTTQEDEFWADIRRNRVNGGAILGPFEAWLLQRGMRTLFLRVRRSSESAMTIAKQFEGHPNLEAVLYPGLASHPGHEIAKRQMQGGYGGMLSLRVKGGEEGALAVVKKCNVFTRATSLGSVESLIEHRYSIEGKSSPIPKDLVRLSIGIESVDDLIADLEQALS